jgi:cytosine/adenosine deaminase-related metal-dependent hydrolase
VSEGTAAGAGIVLAGARLPGDVRVAGVVVVEVGEVRPQPGDEVVDCDGDIVTAGLVNTHMHSWQRMTRGRVVAEDLFGWLRELYPVWERMSVDDAALAALVAYGELAASGCTAAADHLYLVPHGDDSVFDAAIDAAEQVGLRLFLGRGSINLGRSQGGLPPDTLVEDVDTVLSSTERLLGAYAGRDRAEIVVAPNSLFTSTPRLYRESAELARRHGARLHTHLGETADEADFSMRTFGKRPLAVLDEHGWLQPGTWLAHGIEFDEAEIRLLGDRGVGVAHCPSSNARLGDAICPVTDLERAGCPVGLGVDGGASNEVGSIMAELRQALYSARLRARSAGALQPSDCLRLGTTGGAGCLGRPELGRLEPGAAADVAVWPAADLDDIADAASALVLGPERRVKHSLVGGEFVVRDGALLGCDLDAARARLARRARAL